MFTIISKMGIFFFLGKWRKVAGLALDASFILIVGKVMYLLALEGPYPFVYFAMMRCLSKRTLKGTNEVCPFLCYCSN